jgi:hypothetical protein
MNTIVSAFIGDVNCKYTDTLQRYYALGHLLLQSTTPKIVFVDETMAATIGDRYDKENTVLVVVDRRDVYLFEHAEALTDFDVRSTDHSKDTLGFMMTMCSKTEWVRKAVALNSFNTAHFTWVDFGIRHVFRCSDDVFVQKLNALAFKPRAGLRAGGIWDVAEVYPVDLYKDVAWYFAGGVFGGDREALVHFADCVKAKCIEIMTTKKTLMWEVNVWYLLHRDGSCVFDFYPCDHDDTIVDHY